MATTIELLVEGTYMALERGRVDEAEQRVRIALQYGPGESAVAEAAFFVGEARYEAGDMAKAKEHFMAAVAAAPDIAESYLVLADIYLTEGAHQEAAAAADKYLELKPGEQKGQMLAYEAHQKLGNQERADELRYRSYDQGHIQDIEKRIEDRDHSVRPADEREQK